MSNSIAQGDRPAKVREFSKSQGYVGWLRCGCASGCFFSEVVGVVLCVLAVDVNRHLAELR